MNELEYSRPWKIDHSVAQLSNPYWQIINTETGRTKKIGPVQSKGVNYFDRAAKECRRRNDKLVEEAVARDTAKVESFIAAVRELDERAWQEFKPYDHDHACYFHIYVCVNCKAPTYRYRCPLCFWGPEEHSIRSHEASYARANKKGEPMGFERFKRLLARHGSYAPLYFTGNRETVAYSENARYQEMTDWLVEEAASLPAPDPATIWRYANWQQVLAMKGREDNDAT
jgi:hypothetical protein